MLSNSSDQATQQFALQLMAQIEAWEVGYREFLKLDYDWVRITPAANPMLTGEFELISAARPNSIELVGMFESTGKADFNANKSIADIISQAGALADGHNSYVWAIYPDGHVQRIGYAYWNYESVSLTPGTTLYLGANSDSQQIQQLEQDIIQLITMRRGVK
jgi:hypothetical protein